MDAILMLCSLFLKIGTLYFACVAVFALKKRKSYPPAAPGARFAVVLAARNEEAVIAQSVGSILSQDYPPHLRDVYVVPNNCTDRTEEEARAAGAEIISCLGRVRGKGDALKVAFSQLSDLNYDAFLVLDADNTLAPGYLARVNDAVAAGAGVFKTRTVAANPAAGAVAGCYGLYNTVFDLAWNRPRAACGLSAKVIGTGFGFTRQALEELGGWHSETIAEDAEFASRCARRGLRVWWVPEAVNYDEEPTDFLLSLRQRKRWCSGVMQVGRRELPKLWRAGAKGAMLRWDMTMFLLAPFAQALSCLLMLGSLAAALVERGAAVLAAAGGAIALYWLVGVLLAVALSSMGGYGLRKMGGAVLLFPVFMASWLPLQVLSLFWDTRRWTPVAHTGLGRDWIAAG